MKHILVTGGAGYIGSHTVLELLSCKQYKVTVIDNLCNSSQESLHRVARISGHEARFLPLDIRDQPALDELFQSQDFDAVVHFAGLKAVGESVQKPLEYYDNNVAGTVCLCQAMTKAGVKNLVFSSSATVYGDPHEVPIREDFPTSATNPYGRSKLMIEEILGDLYKADGQWNIALLRYFNPVGAHRSGLIGEDPNGIPNNLMPFIAQVAVGKRDRLSVFGNDYDTADGTGVRDYIHVVDLALGHLAALRKLTSSPGLVVYNLGTGMGYSVLDMVRNFEQYSGRPVPYQISARRPGDIAACYADPSLAEQELGWKAQYDIAAMCEDSWRWQSQNPNGYQTS